MGTHECTDPGAFRREVAGECTSGSLLTAACRDTITRAAANYGAHCVRLPIFDNGPPFEAYLCHNDHASGLIGDSCNRSATPRVSPSAVPPSNDRSRAGNVMWATLGTIGRRRPGDVRTARGGQQPGAEAHHRDLATKCPGVGALLCDHRI